MKYIERYLKGEYVQVWNELQALGPAVWEEPNFSDARQVAAETMKRVRKNAELLISRLRERGYVFGVYPDGSRGYQSEGPLVPPSRSTRTDIAALEELAGPLPLSLVAFWEQVGSLDFVGKHPARLRQLDPLVVYPPEGVLAIIEMEGGEEELEAGGSILAGISPDDLHKDNISGGSPYGVSLPGDSADFRVMDERHDLDFVPYLRLAILQYGGFPGLDAQQVQFPNLADLTAGLESF